MWSEKRFGGTCDITLKALANCDCMTFHPFPPSLFDIKHVKEATSLADNKENRIVLLFFTSYIGTTSLTKLGKSESERTRERERERKNAGHTPRFLSKKKKGRPVPIQNSIQVLLERKKHASHSLRSKRQHSKQTVPFGRNTIESIPETFTHTTAWACKRLNPSLRTSLAVEAAT